MGIRIKKEGGCISLILQINCYEYRIYGGKRDNEEISCISRVLYKKCKSCSLQNPVELEQDLKNHFLNRKNW